jgi:hypothetical protein
MSVAPETIWNVPAHRRPRRLGHGSTGHDVDVVFSIDRTDIEARGLTVRVGAANHAFVEPATVELLSSYETRLSKTRPSWMRDEP